MTNCILYVLQVLQSETEAMREDRIALEEKHAQTLQDLASAQTALEKSQDNYLSLQDKLYDVLTAMKQVEQENKLLKIKMATFDLM